MNKRDTTLDDFIKVVQFKVITSIRNHWTSLNAFEADWKYQTTHKDKEANHIFARIVKNFNIEHSTLTNIAGRDEHGSKKLGKFLAQLTKENTRLVYVHKKTATYKKTGKKFNSKSWFYIPFDELHKLFALDGIEGSDPFVVNSHNAYYTDAQHKLIDKYILGFRRDKDRKYIKTNKFFDYQKKRRQGIEEAARQARLNAGTLNDNDIEELIKDIDL